MANFKHSVRDFTRIAFPYFRSEDKWAGRGLLLAVVSLQLFQVWLNVRFNAWYNTFYTALQNKDWNTFIFQIGSTFTTGTGARVRLINGADGCAVFWAVGSSATIGTATSLQGNLMALVSITMTTGATIGVGGGRNGGRAAITCRPRRPSASPAP